MRKALFRVALSALVLLACAPETTPEPDQEPVASETPTLKLFVFDCGHAVFKCFQKIGTTYLNQQRKVAEWQLAKYVLARQLGAGVVLAVAADTAAIGQSDIGANRFHDGFRDQIAEVRFAGTHAEALGIKHDRGFANNDI